jgi:opacity protein-like surface antigen
MRAGERQWGWLARAVAALAVGLAVLAAGGEARAQGFVSPSVGFNFGGDVTNCESVSDCEVRRAGYGVGLGYLGRLFGFEQEVTYTPRFFGESGLAGESAVTTIMSNLLVALPLGPVRPYGTAGVGAMRTSVDFDIGDTVSFRAAGLGWTLGGGVMVLPTQRFGLRVDVRHYRGTDDLEFPVIALGGSTLDFSRASAAAVIRF